VHLILKWLAAGVGFSSTFGALNAEDLVFKSSGTAASLIELYSSEGCSSCPPAEEWTNNLKNAPGLWKYIFPVVFHVDYWDGLGWPDRFARAEFTQRQRDYAARLGQDSVYTPEFVLNGQEWRRSGLSGQDIPAMGGAKSGALALSVATSAKVAKILAFYTSGAPSSASLQINVALVGFNVITDVTRGENSGRTLRHDFVVLGFESKPLAPDSKGIFSAGPIEVQSSTDDTPGAIIAWVSQADGTILQVAGGWLPAGGH
jgi:hypothetical protein